MATIPFARWMFVFASSMTLASVACRRSAVSADAFSIHEAITPQPVRIGEATVKVQLADNAAQPITNATMMVEADMTHPGMNPVFMAATETAPGNYESKINFTMGGDWVVLLHIRLGNGVKIERQMDVRDVRPN